MTITCSIVDDEPLAVNLLESYVNKTPFLELRSTYPSAVEAMEGLRREPVDLLFLDIQMPELTGLEFSKIVNPDTRIVFTTAFGQYALDGYKVNALDYLLKPISYVDFLATAHKAHNTFELSNPNKEEEHRVTAPPDSLFIKSDHKIVRIPYKDILYIEGLKDYVKIYLKGKDRALLTLTSMKALEVFLTSEYFLRTHRSYIVNMNAVEQIERGQIIVNGKAIPVSEGYKESVANYVNTRMPQSNRA